MTSIRQLRSSTVAERSNMAPAVKRRKTEVPKFLCYSCQTERVSSQFPDYNPGAECDHLIHTCKACLKQWVEVQVESGNFVKRTDVESGGNEENARAEKRVDDLQDGVQKVEQKAKEGDEELSKGLLFGIKCPHPDCDGVMRNVNVQMAAARKVYQRFVELERKFIGDATPGWRWCLDAGCKAGQVHAPLLLKQKQEEQAASEPPAKPAKRGKKKNPIVVYEDAQNPSPTEADIFSCNTCGARACIPCDRPYHVGETCAEFQIRTKGRLEEEDKTVREIEKATKACPGCTKRIQKNGGCPNMRCAQCNSHFCWTCASLFERGRWCRCSHNRMPLHEQQRAAGL